MWDWLLKLRYNLLAVWFSREHNVVMNVDFEKWNAFFYFEKSVISLFKGILSTTLISVSHSSSRLRDCNDSKNNLIFYPIGYYDDGL